MHMAPQTVVQSGRAEVNKVSGSSAKLAAELQKPGARRLAPNDLFKMARDLNIMSFRPLPKCMQEVRMGAGRNH